MESYERQFTDPITGGRVWVSLMPEDKNKLWLFRLACRSESGKCYTISISKHSWHWACSCRGYTQRSIRECRHLRACHLLKKADPTPPPEILQLISPLRWYATMAALKAEESSNVGT